MVVAQSLRLQPSAHLARYTGLLLVTALLIWSARPEHTRALDAAVTPLQRAHAHNDYKHEHPLCDALARGFNSVEADIWLVQGELLVAHEAPQSTSPRTLEALYLRPLLARVTAQHGSVYRGSSQSLQLLVDVKSDAALTYDALEPVLARYASMLTTFDRDGVHPGAVTVVLSGHCARELIAAEPRRYAACDGRIDDVGRAVSPALVPLISDRWGAVFTWQGDGAMPQPERAKLRELVRTAHAQSQRVRFWATPETAPAQVAVWSELLAADVDYINTDALDTLREFLLSRDHVVPR